MSSGIFRRIRLHPSNRGFIYHTLWTFIIIEGIVKLIFRWFSGRDLLHPANERPTNATFLKRGTKTYDPRARLSFWAYMPECKRGLIRTTLTINFLFGIWGWIGGSWRGKTVVYLTFVLACMLLTRHIILSHRLRKLRREYIIPLGFTIAPIINQDTHNVTDWLTIPPKLINLGYWFPALPSWMPTSRTLLTWKQKRRNNAIVPTATISYPKDLNVDQRVRQAVNDNIAMKLGDGEWIIKWHSVGANPYIGITRKPEPPELVTFTDIRDAVSRAPDAAPIMGRSAQNFVSVNLDTDAPHAAASCGSGAGKSVLLKGLITQWLHHGVHVIILDNKQISQHWCKDHPNVVYCRTAEEFFKNLVWLSEELKRRFEQLSDIPADQEIDDVDVGQRIVCVFEEQNDGMQELVTHWQTNRAKGEPQRSPAIAAYNTILTKGRQAKIHIFSVAQLFTVQCCGGNPTARENYGARILARATFRAWEMLAPECKPYPKLSNKRGRMALATAGETTVFQVALWSTKEAREWAFDVQTEQSPLQPELEQKPVESLVSLAEAAREKIVPYSYGTLRNLRSTDSDFPAPINRKYRPNDLIRWHDKRISKVA